MRHAQTYYPECPEALIVSLARTGDGSAFEELVRRRQSSVRGLMRRFCGDPVLADDLAQQVFLQAWRKIGGLRKARAFGGWLKRIAVSTWLQHLRRQDALRGASELPESQAGPQDSPGVAKDLEEALALLPDTVRLCIVLSYQEGLSHREIADLAGLPLGTVKSHIKRGSERLKESLAVYADAPKAACKTCHKGYQQPLQGTNVIADWPELATTSGEYVYE